MQKPSLVLLISLVLAACSKKDPAQEAIDASINAHGFDRLMENLVSFEFRNRVYSVSFPENQKIYTRSFQDDSLGNIKDVLVNSWDFRRYVEGELIEVDVEWSGRYSNSVNSVLYFFQLPFGLNETAVIKKYLGRVSINQESYHKIQVTFEQEGGGEDYQDIFVYWIHAQDNTMDYLAYSYETDGGGVRFRQAINRRTIDGMLFQDYINYKPKSKDINVELMDDLFENGELIELSRIENSNIQVSKLER